MRTIVAGPRDLAVQSFVDRALLMVQDFHIMGMGNAFFITEVVSGGAPGVDACGETWSRRVLGKEPTVFPVTEDDWERIGKSAGPRRNQRMVDYVKTDPAGGALVVIKRQGVETSGTSDVIRRAKKAKLRVVVHEITRDGEALEPYTQPVVVTTSIQPQDGEIFGLTQPKTQE